MPRAHSNTHPDPHAIVHLRGPASRPTPPARHAGLTDTAVLSCSLAHHRDALQRTRAPWRRRMLAMAPLLMAIGLSLLVTG
ncbi:hypothetical protein IP91_00258 [Pseudoduganella lurida]|uniref:Uncharacterized protein n=1 Tax=Pseudoduganella lurida TaxID=1036180 RepID=A0A562RJD6_9BURK|nr:hypothetical protein IP91_00258 [Pseudoduganella lurida]